MLDEQEIFRGGSNILIFKTTKGGGFLTHSLSRTAKPTEADIAYEVLKDRGNPMHYQSLIEEVFRRVGIPQDALQIAAVLTQINLDTRFAFLGRGEWGLKVWESTKASRRSHSISLMPKSSLEKGEKSDSDELDDMESFDEEALDMDDDGIDEELPDEKW